MRRQLLMTSAQPPSVLHPLMNKTDHMNLLDTLCLCLLLWLYLLSKMFSRTPGISSKSTTPPPGSLEKPPSMPGTYSRTTIPVIENKTLEQTKLLISAKQLLMKEKRQKPSGGSRVKTRTPGASSRTFGRSPRIIGASLKTLVTSSRAPRTPHGPLESFQGPRNLLKYTYCRNLI